MIPVDAPTALVQHPSRRTFRLAVVAASVALAVAGVVLLLATRQTGDGATTRTVAATLHVPSHPGAVVAGHDALWLALNGAAGDPIGEKPLLRLDLGPGPSSERPPWPGRRRLSHAPEIGSSPRFATSPSPSSAVAG